MVNSTFSLCAPDSLSTENTSGWASKSGGVYECTEDSLSNMDWGCRDWPRLAPLLTDATAKREKITVTCEPLPLSGPSDNVAPQDACVRGQPAATRSSTRQSAMDAALISLPSSRRGSSRQAG